MNWKEIISEKDLNHRVNLKIEDIASSLERAYEKQNNIWLLNGKGGIILFFCYYNLFRGSDRFNSKIIQFVQEMEADLNNGSPINFEYGSGYSGLFWLLNFLSEDFIDSDAISKEILDVTFKFTNRIIEQKNDFDFLNGSLGNLFFLNEVSSDSRILDLVRMIKQKGVEDKTTFVLPATGSGGILNLDRKIHNLSLAHGLPSFVIILCYLFEKNKDNDIKTLIEKSTNFILSTKNPKNSFYKSVFPSFVEVENRNSYATSRFAWCYGDMGSALSLYKASVVLNKEELFKEAIDVFNFNTNRRETIHETHISDAEFCHGTSGIAHIYNRMYQRTENTKFKETALYWYKRTLDLAFHNNACAGYKALKHTGDFVDDYNLLEGISGIGLALISSVSGIEPKWDKCLLIS